MFQKYLFISFYSLFNNLLNNNGLSKFFDRLLMLTCSIKNICGDQQFECVNIIFITVLIFEEITVYIRVNISHEGLIGIVIVVRY